MSNSKRLVSYGSLFLFTLLMISCSTDSKQRKTSGGYDYIVHTSGNTEIANVGDYVYYEMEIKGEDGKILQSMKGLPKMPVIQIPESKKTDNMADAIMEVMSSCAVRDSVTLYIPVDSIPNAPASVANFKQISYDILIRDVADEQEYKNKLLEENKILETAKKKMAGAGDEVGKRVQEIITNYKAGKLDEQVMTHETGLKYIIDEKGDGPMPKRGQNITTHYYGINLGNQEMFDNSYRAGRPYSFALETGSVIQGWHTGFAQLPVGSKAVLIIPYNMAYGEAGRPPQISAKSDLVFYVDFLKAE